MMVLESGKDNYNSNFSNVKLIEVTSTLTLATYTNSY